MWKIVGNIYKHCKTFRAVSYIDLSKDQWLKHIVHWKALEDKSTESFSGILERLK